MKKNFTAIIEKEDNIFVALCPEIDVASQGKTIEDAKKNLSVAVELFFEQASKSEIKKRMRSETYITQLEIAMGNLKVLSGKEVCQILIKIFSKIRQKGSHIVKCKKVIMIYLHGDCSRTKLRELLFNKIRQSFFKEILQSII